MRIVVRAKDGCVILSVAGDIGGGGGDIASGVTDVM